MKILLANKYFHQKGGSETVFFQERDFLTNNGHIVIDFSMEHPNNLPSEYSEYFVPNVDYKDGSKAGRLASPTRKFSIAVDFIHNREAIKRLSSLIEKEKADVSTGGRLYNGWHNKKVVRQERRKGRGMCQCPEECHRF